MMSDCVECPAGLRGQCSQKGGTSICTVDMEGYLRAVIGNDESQLGLEIDFYAFFGMPEVRRTQ